MKYCVALLAFVLLTSCSSPTFYKKTYQFNKSISTGDFEKAEQFLDAKNREKLEKGKIRFLYFVNAGVLQHLEGNFAESNEYFEKADLFIEDEKKKVAERGAAFLLNPNLSTYFGEDHEVLLINYYKALNYYLLDKPYDALVEVRRLNLRLQTLSEKYKSDKKYTQDAYMHLLMGLIYEVNKEYNDAFIAYRNAYEIYQSDYKDQFGLEAPLQLKKDLIRTAGISGMRSEMLQYQNEFGMQYEKETSDANMIMLWHNGMGPVKQEWGINFAIIENGGGWIMFVSEKYGLSFPFYIGNNNLNGVTWIKVVFPKYAERPMIYSSAEVVSGDKNYPLELTEDINAISFKVLNERMMLEFSKSLLRVALKQAAAYKAGQSADSPALGAALSIVASATESADTRNWQTIPHSIYYTRVPLNVGDNEIEMKLKGSKVDTHKIEVEAAKGQTIIYPFYSLGALEPKEN